MILDMRDLLNQHFLWGIKRHELNSVTRPKMSLKSIYFNSLSLSKTQNGWSEIH